MNHGNVPQKPRPYFTHCMLASLTINYILKNTGNIKVSEISLTEKDRYHVFTLMWILRNLTETHGGGEGKKKEVRVEENQSIRDS